MKTYRLLLLLLTLHGNLASARAQSVPSVPTLINYQGQLTDVAGQPLPTADYVLTFSIFDASTGGNLVWGPQLFEGGTGPGHGPKVPVVQGYFNVILGQVDTTNRPIVAAFSSPERFVEVQVGTNLPLTPRQRILSAPYAIRAAAADRADTAANADTAQTALKAVDAQNAVKAVDAQNALKAVEAQNAVKAADSDKLAGFDWTALVGVNNPMTGKIPQSKLELPPLKTLAVSAPVGGVGVSKSAFKDYTLPGTDYVLVEELTVTLETRGNPVVVMLIPRVDGNVAIDAPAASNLVRFFLRIDRGSTIIAEMEKSDFGGRYIRSNNGDFRTLDFPPAGSHKYTIRLKADTNGGARVDRIIFTGQQLVAYEL